ncbi:MAG: sugar-transfer associated ATP-grasp domain-containing protein [Pseudomonadota bacterium]
MIGMARRFWRNLPLDGQGLGRPVHPTLSPLSRWASRAWRLERAPSLHKVVGLASRLLWCIAALFKTMRFSRLVGQASFPGLYRDCLQTGATPLEAHVWRSFHATPHPLPARAAALLQSRLGAPEAHRLLADKLETATVLSGAGILFPELIVMVERGGPVALPLLTAVHRPLFLKPRHGHGHRHAFSLEPKGGEWLIDGRIISEPDLYTRLDSVLREDDLLIQERLTAASDLADLVVAGRAPVLRLVTARMRGAEPFLHSALLTVGVPDRNPAHFLEGAVHVPVDGATGRMLRGLSLSRPDERLERLPWNASVLTGRPLPDFDRAVNAALIAMHALPPLPLVHWDVILTGSGPVFLEGNSSGNWIIASLPALEGETACDLADLLARWRPC